MAKNRFIPTGKVASVPSGVSFQMPSEETEEELTIEPIAESTDEPVTEEQDSPVEEVKEITTVISTPVVEVAKVVEKAPVVTTEKGKIDMNVQHQLERYAEAMAVGKPIKPAEGGQHQYGLYKLIKGILATEEQSEFTTRFNTLLSFVKNNQTKVFSENYVFRFPMQWGGSDSEFTNFRRIMTVIIATADPATRASSLGGISMELAMEGFTEKEKNKLIVFYNL